MIRFNKEQVEKLRGYANRIREIDKKRSSALGEVFKEMKDDPLIPDSIQWCSQSSGWLLEDRNKSELVGDIYVFTEDDYDRWYTLMNDE